MAFSATFNSGTHGRVLLLLLGILGACFALLGISYHVGLEVGLNTFAFMVVEVRNHAALLHIMTVWIGYCFSFTYIRKFGCLVYLATLIK